MNVPTIEDPAKANVNHAAAKEIEAGAPLPPSAVEAMVAYRKRHPDFRAIGDWCVVYGVDGA